ncbi:MAG: glutathione-disulfide reductase [Gammaproteobacteria bacterium]|nr:glutathione-disulfide reductase [Gammaproteobacteria bacterium]
MTHSYDYDLFVIGAGSGGVRAARVAGNLGARVGIAEERYFGGTCVNVGCIPKKLFVYASHFAEDFLAARGYGWDVAAQGFDWSTLLANKDREISRLNNVYEQLLSGAQVHIHQARATLTGPNEVDVGGRRVSARHILIATGGWPVVPEIPGRELAITSNEVFALPELPRRIVIVGGGYIAVEFAGIFHGLGVETTLIYRGPLFLRGFDDDIRRFLAEEMTKRGVDIRFELNVASMSKDNDDIRCALTDGSELLADQVLFATGRRPLSDGLNLGDVGVETDAAGAIKVDEQYVTSVPSILAIGDVTNRVQLTPVALAEGMFVARKLFAPPARTVDYDYIPTAVFSQPDIATVGFTEREARQRFASVDVYRSAFTPLRETLTRSNHKTLMKMIVDRDSDKVVGIHMAGPEAGEIIQGMAVAMRAGATKAIFDSTIGIHPTAAEEFVTMRTPVKD